MVQNLVTSVSGISFDTSEALRWSLFSVAMFNIAAATCDNPVADQYQLGQQVGVTGTPAIVTATGLLYPGYLPAAELAARIGVE